MLAAQEISPYFFVLATVEKLINLRFFVYMVFNLTTLNLKMFIISLILMKGLL